MYTPLKQPNSRRREEKHFKETKENREMRNDQRQNGEERDDELQYESSSSISDAESCSSDSEDEAISDQNQPSDCRNFDASGPVYDFSSLMAQLPNPNK